MQSVSYSCHLARVLFLQVLEGGNQRRGAGRGEAVFSRQQFFRPGPRCCCCALLFLYTRVPMYALTCGRCPPGPALRAPRPLCPQPRGAGPGAGPRRDAARGAGSYKQAGARCRLRRFPAGEAGGSGRWFPRTPPPDALPPAPPSAPAGAHGTAGWALPYGSAPRR